MGKLLGWSTRVFNNALEQLEGMGLTTANVLYIGDGINDFKAARLRGIKFVATTTGFASREHFIEAGLDGGLILPSFNRLPSFLSELSVKAA